MEELCRSIANQNATILTGRSAGSLSSCAPVAHLCQQSHTERATKKTQGDADDGEKSTKSNDSEEDDKGLEPKSVDKSFTDELSACIPEDSILMRSMRDRKPKGFFVTERYPVGREISNLEDGLLQDFLADSESSAGGTLIIQDINLDWAVILRSEFPRSAHTTFLAEHMARLDGESVMEASLRQLGKEIRDFCPDAKMRGKNFSEECLALDFGFPFQSPKHKGVHTDFLFDTMKLESVDRDYSFFGGTRQTIYEKDDSGYWRRASHRMSWCQLAAQFYLVLVDSSPGFDQEISWAALAERPYQIRLDPRIDAAKFRTQSRLVIQYAPWENPEDCLKSMIIQLLQCHTMKSLFAPVAVPINETTANVRPEKHGLKQYFTSSVRDPDDRAHELSPIWGNRQIITWLLTESSWQLAISNLEYKWQHVRCRVTKQAGDESFMMLTRLRRQVADSHDFIAEAKGLFAQKVKSTGRWIVHGKIISADEFWSARPGASTTAAFRRAESMDIRNLHDSFEKMEERVSAMTRAINQEIQVVIGSVQVEDAKTMKRQTEWMVALALLAAIYLPMTLVTGIFGMNISEINADATLPSRWAALKAWGIVFGATLGCILMYAMARRLVRWLLEQREIAKIEAMHVEALKVR